MTVALIGHTGWVGSNICRQIPVDHHINRENIAELRGRSFDTLLIAGPSGTKYLANRDPQSDRRQVDSLLEVLETVRARRWIVMSTIDVMPEMNGSDETLDCDLSPNHHAYGRHRRRLEKRILDRGGLSVRLPSLFGPGIRKGPFFDILCNHRTEFLNPASEHQWFDLRDIGELVRGLDSYPWPIVIPASEGIRLSEIRDLISPEVRMGGPEQLPLRIENIRPRHFSLIPRRRMLEKIQDFARCYRLRPSPVADPVT